MANEFDAKLVINTAEAVNNVRALDTASAVLDKTLLELDKTIRTTEGGVKEIAQAMTAIVASERQAAAAAKERAQATIAMSRADAVAAKTANDNAVAQAKIGTETAKQSVATSRAAEIDNRAALAKQRLADAAKRADTSNASTAANRDAIAGARVEAINAQRALSEERLQQAQVRTAMTTDQKAAADQRAARAALELNDNLSNSRYLLYDVGATYAVLSAGLLAIPVATATVASNYQKDFAQVIRTTEGTDTNVGQLRDSLKGLAAELPVSFADLSKIAGLGAQLGLSGTAELTKFTDAVAKFSASTSVSVEDAATAFGRLSTSFPKDAQAADFFNKIGSAIALVGARSVATDPEIVGVLNQIGPLGNVAGFTAEQMVGLAGAMASVRIRPEMARGSFQRTILDISAAADQGSVAMQKYSQYMHMSGDAAVALFKQDPGQFFQQFIGGVKGALDAGTSMNTIFDSLNLKNVRDKQFVIALANGYGVLTGAMKNADKGWTEGNFLNESSAHVFDTLQANVQKMANAFQNLGDTLGAKSLGFLSEVVGALAGLASGVDDIIKANPALGAFINTLMGIGAVLGVLLAVKAAQAFVVAGLIGFQQVAGKQGVAAAMSLKGAIQQVSVTMLMAKGMTSQYANELVRANGAMGGYATGMQRMNVSSVAGAGAATQAAGAMGRLGTAAKGVGSAIFSLAGGTIGAAIGALTILAGAFAYPAQKAEEMATAMKGAMDDTGKITQQGVQQITADLNKVPDMADFFYSGNVGFSGIGKSVKDVAADVKIGSTEIIAAASGSSDAMKQLKTDMDNIAKAHGFKDAMDAINSPISGDLGFQLSRINDFVNSHTVALKKNQDATKDSKNAQSALAGGMSSTNGAIGGQTDQIDKLSDSIEKAVRATFGLSDAQGAAQAALYDLGQTLEKSIDFSNFSEGGRANLKNLQNAIAEQGKFLGEQVQNNKITAEQAATDYSSFVDGLLQTLAAKGVDVAQIQGVADQAKAAMQSQLNNGVSNPSVMINAQVDRSQLDNAKKFLDDVARQYGKIDVTVLAKQQGTEQVVNDVYNMQTYIQAVTGQPYVATVTADTSAANQNVANTQEFVVTAFGQTFTAVVDANTNPAMQALQALAQYAASVVNHIIDGMNSARSFVHDITGGLAPGDPVQHVGWGEVAAPVQKAAPVAPAVPKTYAAPPAQVTAPSSNLPAANPNANNFKGLQDGYQNAADAAKKAGDAGKKAGQDMANGIDDATQAANDYANRLKQGLDSAYQKQYGLQAATDEYYKALNAIQKKREDDLKTIDDLIQKQKELNNARNQDLIDANKAKTEQGISQKYGEVARAADYGNQAQTALDNAAAKKKEMDADAAQQKTLQDGMYALTGYSDAAISNREALRGLEQKMLDMVVAYAQTGASTQQVAAFTQNLTAQFSTQVAQLGFNRIQLANVIGDMGRYTAAVAAVPYFKPTTLSNNAKEATGPVSDYADALNAIPPFKSTRVEYNVVGGLVPVPNTTIANGQQVYRVQRPDGGFDTTEVYNRGGRVKGYANGGLIPGKPPADPREDNLFAKVDGKGMVKVRSGEFIVRQEAVDYWGSDFLKAINDMKMPAYNYGGSIGAASSSGGGGVVGLDSASLAALQRIADREVALYSNDEKIATSANNGNQILASKGMN